jgi:hypothetical protein
MQEHPIIAFLTGGGLLMGLVFYVTKDLISKIDYLKKKTHEQDIRIAVMENEIKQVKK